MPKGLSSRYLSQIQSGIIPDPADLSPDEQQHLISQPWFQKALDLHSAGVNPTPEMIQKLMLQPGSQGFKFQAIDPQDESKGHILVDLASGKTVPHTDIIRPDFKPQLVPQKDETGKILGYGMTASPESAVVWKEGEKGTNPLMNAIPPGTTRPIYDPQTHQAVSYLINDGTKIHTVTPMSFINSINAGQDPNAPAVSGTSSNKSASSNPSPTPAPGFSTGEITITNPNAVPAPAGPSAEPAADKFTQGTKYKDANGLISTYIGNGQWQ